MCVGVCACVGVCVRECVSVCAGFVICGCFGNMYVYTVP